MGSVSAMEGAVMGKKSSKSTTGPSKFAKPYIQSGVNEVTNAYNANKGNIASISDILAKNMPGVVDSTINNEGLSAANTLNTDTLNGKYLQGNPYLQQIIDQTNRDVTDGVNSGIGMRGVTGGSAHAQILARELAKSESNLRYTDYSKERGYQDAAIGKAAGLSTANDANIQTLLQYLTGAATIPTVGAENYSDQIAKLMGQYTTTTAKNSTLDNILNTVSAASSAYKSFSGGSS
tara:strand:- start:711 stop:1415 length:705 start_codon:yes stop_codon:yes gene_type:complete